MGSVGSRLREEFFGADIVAFFEEFVAAFFEFVGGHSAGVIVVPLNRRS